MSEVHGLQAKWLWNTLPETHSLLSDHFWTLTFECDAVSYFAGQGQWSSEHWISKCAKTPDIESHIFESNIETT